jgi:aminoglycoside phosphotransferase family enzyme
MGKQENCVYAQFYLASNACVRAKSAALDLEQLNLAYYSVRY